MATRKALNPTPFAELASQTADLEWAPCLIACNPTELITVLIDDLSARAVPKGAGKKITSGLSYWGLGPAIAWSKACNDPYYRVMNQSIKSFSNRSRQIREELKPLGLNYLSLGVGTGEKDGILLRTLKESKDSPTYYPVDMSPEMLRMGCAEVASKAGIALNLIAPVQLDFANHQSLTHLRRCIRYSAPDEPLLISLLGNTLANFDDDVGLLRHVTEALDPGDMLLLELAFTDVIDEVSAERAAREYDSGTAFRKFAASALLQHTNLDLQLEDVECVGSTETDRAIIVRTVYRSPQKTKLITPDWTDVADLAKGEPIRLYLSRKYSKAGISRMLSDCNLELLRSDFSRSEENPPFGIGLFLVSRRSQTPRRRTSQTQENRPDNGELNLKAINSLGMIIPDIAGFVGAGTSMREVREFESSTGSSLQLDSPLTKTEKEFVAALESSMFKQVALWNQVYPDLSLLSGMEKARTREQLNETVTKMRLDFQSLLDFLKDKNLTIPRTYDVITSILKHPQA